MTTTEQIQTTTPFGLPIDESFAKPAADESIQRAAKALKARNFEVQVFPTLAEARAYVISVLSKDQSTILTASSETVTLSGLDEDINRSGKFNAIRPQLEKMDRKTQRPQMIKLAASPDVVVGSAHAVTEDGRVITASASGSQLGPYASGAGKVILVVGSQKVVPDIETAMRRVQYYSYPKEDIRAREKYGMPSALLKVLTMNGDMPGRTTVVLVHETVGF